jgi:hypothetical protein
MSTPTEQLKLALRLALRAHHTNDADAAALIRTWPHLVDAAQDAHEQFDGSGASGPAGPIDRITVDARAMAALAGRRVWPARRGPLDASLQQVTAALRRSTEVSQAGPPGDQKEADRLILSTLWSTSQLVGRVVRDRAFDLRTDPGLSEVQKSEQLPAVRDLARRFNALEQLAAESLHSGRGIMPAMSPQASHFRHAIAAWDVQAHRALMDDRSTAVLHVLSHLEAESVKGLGRFVSQAADSGIIDQVTADRLSPILSDSSASWARLRDVSAELSFSSVPVPMGLIQAGRNLQEQFSVTSAAADPSDHRQLLLGLTGHLASAVTISAAVRETIDSGELRAPAKAIARVMTEQNPGHDHTPVDPVAIQRRLTLPLNSDVRRLLEGPALRVFLDADEAMNRSAGLDVMYRSTAIPASATGTEAKPTIEHRRPVPMSPSAAAPPPAR